MVLLPVPLDHATVSFVDWPESINVFVAVKEVIVRGITVNDCILDVETGRVALSVTFRVTLNVPKNARGMLKVFDVDATPVYIELETMSVIW
jgi:hypothetical protein